MRTDPNGARILRWLDVPRRVAAERPAVSRRVMDVAGMFGIAIDEDSEQCLHESTRVPLPERGTVYITGPSGGGKSTLLYGIEAACRRAGIGVINVADLPMDCDSALVDGLGGSLEEVCAMLARAGLGEARSMISRPYQLSAGQRARWAFANAIAWARIAPRPTVILVDEFASALDRITAGVLARNGRRIANDLGVTLVAATAHDDLVDALWPEVLIHVDLGGVIEVAQR